MRNIARLRSCPLCVSSNVAAETFVCSATASLGCLFHLQGATEEGKNVTELIVDISAGTKHI